MTTLAAEVFFEFTYDSEGCYPQCKITLPLTKEQSDIVYSKGIVAFLNDAIIELPEWDSTLKEAFIKYTNKPNLKKLIPDLSDPEFFQKVWAKAQKYVLYKTSNEDIPYDPKKHQSLALAYFLKRRGVYPFGLTEIFGATTYGRTTPWFGPIGIQPPPDHSDESKLHRRNYWIYKQTIPTKDKFSLRVTSMGHATLEATTSCQPRGYCFYCGANFIESNQTECPACGKKLAFYV